MRVTPDAGLSDDYELKLNSYDLAVDIELYDAVQRLRFEHPEVKAVVVTGGIDKVFCAGANIQMLAGSTHGHKVNFCKFTNETRNGIEDATAQLRADLHRRRQRHGRRRRATSSPWRATRSSSLDDRASSVSLPEVPLLAVLPGTGGLTRLVDKRFVRRDLADVFATRTEGIKGQQAVDWGLVDAIAPRSRFDDVVARAGPGAGRRSRLARTRRRGVDARPARVDVDARRLRYDHVTSTSTATSAPPTSPSTARRASRSRRPDGLVAAGAPAWLLAAARQLDDAMLRLRFNEPEVGTWVLHTAGDAGRGARRRGRAGRARRPLAGQRAAPATGRAR